MPGDYEAPLTPTVPGDYTFHLTGTIHGQAIDETATSSDSTFDSAVEATAIEFPTKLPSLSEVVTRLDRIDSRLAASPGPGALLECLARATGRAVQWTRRQPRKRRHHRRSWSASSWAGSGPSSGWCLSGSTSAHAGGHSTVSGTRIGWATLATGFALVAALALAGPALAHALPQSSDPAAGATLATPPTQVTITFGERPDPKLSTIRVLDTSGKPVTSGPTAVASDNALALTVPLGPLPIGVYTVAWRTVSAVDGHEAAGSFSFGVGVAPTAPNAATAGAAEVQSSSSSPAGVLSRFLLYVGLIGLFGAGFVGSAVHPRPPRSIVRLAAGAWLLSAVGVVGVIAVQLADSGADLGTFMGSALGGLVAGRLAVAAGSGIVVGVLFARGARANRLAFAVVALGAAGGMLADVVAGHAAAGDLANLQVVAQWVHILAVGSWVGGLAALLLSVRGSVAEEKTVAVRRFSRWAGFALAAIAATGLLRAIQEVGTLDALVSSDFGRVVIAKSVLFGALALLGATNHFISVPAAARDLGLLRRIGRVEMAVGAVVLLLTGLLVNLAPPSSQAAAPTAPHPASAVIVDGHDFGTSVKVRLEATPGAAGFNTFRATVTDYDTGAPVAADHVTLRFSIAARSDVGGSRLDLAPSGPGSSPRRAATCRSRAPGRSRRSSPVAPRRSRSRCN